MASSASPRVFFAVELGCDPVEFGKRNIDVGHPVSAPGPDPTMTVEAHLDDHATDPDALMLTSPEDHRCTTVFRLRS